MGPQHKPTMFAVVNGPRMAPTVQRAAAPSMANIDHHDDIWGLPAKEEIFNKFSMTGQAGNWKKGWKDNLGPPRPVQLSVDLASSAQGLWSVFPGHRPPASS